MRKFSQINEQRNLDIQKNSVNFLTKDELEKYLEIADKFISEATKNICRWLIDNNDTYVDKLSNGGDNALEDFYVSGKPTDDSLKKLFSWIGEVNKSGKLLEIPVFQSREQFDLIISKKISPDEVILDLKTERGRNEVAKRFEPLLHKIVNEWVGKSSLDRDELMSVARLGFTYAMNGYGKKSNKQTKKDNENNTDFDTSSYKQYTFLQFASQIIRNNILDAIKTDSHLVRIPISRQKKEREEKGYIAKSNSVSGDKPMGSKDGGDGKSLFDLVGGMENPGKSIDRAEIDDLWKEITDKLEEKFGKKTMDIFYNHFGWGGRKKMTGKEMAAKYGYNSASSITAEIAKVINFIKKDKNMFRRFQDIFELMKEAKHDEDEYMDDNEPIYVNSRLIKEFNGLNNIDGDE